MQRQRYDPVFLGFTQPDIKYEWNKLYVLGLRHKSSRDSLKNFMELVSGGAYKVRHLEWFGNGKAIVTLNTKKLSGPGNT